MIAKWIGKRVIMGTIVLIVVSFLSFFILHAAPGDPAAAYYGGNLQTLTTAEKERIAQAFGLDKPVLAQYAIWLREAITGNLGYSAKEGRAVSTILLEKLPNTLQLVGITLMILAIISTWFGLLAGMKEGSLLDRGLSIFSIASSAVPSFWLGILLMMIFSVQLGWFPSSGMSDVRGGGGIADRLHHIFLPVAVLVLSHVGIFARFLQDCVKSESKSYYVQVARANGVAEQEIRKNILRNAFIPYVNYVGVTIPSFFGGSIVVESLFGWSGLGQLLVKSVMVKDFPLLMGGVLIIGVVVVVSLFIIDVLMVVINPKLRRGVLRC
ncbi:ABC transporter permease [Lysinibacillus parviboronicapiens]|uniref:ABC transporter permease n=1 Tax=Lysinibacillus parviboronicapiens TaxID=436516 RepID=UPI000D3DC530|nr:ABC transporter permease [Lysinibacillus parviboronicapiens]